MCFAKVPQRILATGLVRFGVSSTHNRDCRAMIKTVLLSSLFGVREGFCGWFVSLLSYENFSPRVIEPLRGRESN